LDVHAFNQRSIAGILDMIRMLGAMVRCERTGPSNAASPQQRRGPCSAV
jgi:hypothetical protein